MSLHPLPTDSIPAGTLHTARAAFPRGNLYMRMRDELGSIYSDEQFTTLFAVRGQPAYAPWRLALVLVFQFIENLSDRQAAEALRARIDWKYALGLELTDPGFDHSLLSEFRDRLLAHSAESQLLDIMLARFSAAGLLRGRGRQRSDSTHVLAAVRALNRLELVGETMRQALNVLAVAAGDWLRPHIQPAWDERYSRRFDSFRLPTDKTEQASLALTIGADGSGLLAAIYSAQAPAWLGEVPALKILQQVWEQQYIMRNGVLDWRTIDELPPAAALIDSPYDAEARHSLKRSTEWTGYKLHLTETCGDEGPHIITGVLTTPATTPDNGMINEIQSDLERKGLLPQEQYVDAGYVNSKTLVSSGKRGIALEGPTPQDSSWQQREASGYAVRQFEVDWEQQKAVCPNGEQSVGWWRRIDKQKGERIYVRFGQQACAGCAVREKCTRGEGPRVLSLLPREEWEALGRRRAEQEQEEFKERYRLRAGVEGSISQGVRRSGMRQARYRGMRKTHLQHVASAAALNYVRAWEWYEERQMARTRSSAFARLVAQAA